MLWNGSDIKIVGTDSFNGVFRKLRLKQNPSVLLYPASPLSGFVEILEARRDGSIQALQGSAVIEKYGEYDSPLPLSIKEKDIIVRQKSCARLPISGGVWSLRKTPTISENI